MTRRGQAKTARARTFGHKGLAFRLVVGIFLAGLLWSNRQAVAAISHLNPAQILLVIYMLMGLFLVFALGGVEVAGSRIGLRHIFGILLFIFAFNIVFTHISSPWGQHVIGKEPEVNPILYASEDGVVYYYVYPLARKLSYPLLFWDSAEELAAFITYALVPLILVITASFLLTPSQLRKAVRSKAL